MEERLGNSAKFWRGVAGVTMVLGIIGSLIIAVVVARRPYGDGFDAGVFFTILIPSILGLMLSLGVFFMISWIMEGLAELIGYGGHLPAVTGTSVASAGARSSSPHWIGRPRE
jgi:phosphotransferase system  glucose/maltose/N-acetylglucosamine-specific IIC component